MLPLAGLVAFRALPARQPLARVDAFLVEPVPVVTGLILLPAALLFQPAPLPLEPLALQLLFLPSLALDTLALLFQALPLALKPLALFLQLSQSLRFLFFTDFDLYSFFLLLLVPIGAVLVGGHVKGDAGPARQRKNRK